MSVQFLLSAADIQSHFQGIAKVGSYINYNIGFKFGISTQEIFADKALFRNLL